MTQVSKAHGHGARHVRSTKQFLKIDGEKWGHPGRPCRPCFNGLDLSILPLHVTCRLERITSLQFGRRWPKVHFHISRCHCVRSSCARLLSFNTYQGELLSSVKALYEGKDVFMWLPTRFGNSICSQARHQDFQRGVTFWDSCCQINFNGIAWLYMHVQDKYSLKKQTHSFHSGGDVCK